MNRRLPFPTLMLVTDRHRSRTPLVAAVRGSVAAGVDLVQLREPDLPDAEFRRLAIELLDVVPAEQLIVNGRPDIAREIGSSLHQRDGAGWVSANGRTGIRGYLGLSIHEQSRTVDNPERLDYLLAGNVFETRSHPGRPARGIVWLEGLIIRSAIPVIAIGGISAANLAPVMATGCRGVAVIDAILDQEDPAEATRTLRLALDDSVANRTEAETTQPAKKEADLP